MVEERSSKQRKRWLNVSYTTKVVGAFVAVSVMTALVAFCVLSIVWQQHFQTYTRENVERTAQVTAASIGKRYEQTYSWYNGALSPAESVHTMSGSLGVQVLDREGNVIYDDARVGDEAQLVPVPDSRESMASADITVDGVRIGTVRVWVYGSQTLLTQADEEFRNQSYSAMIMSSALAMVIALLLGFVFARSLVTPINRITRTAKLIEGGDMSARTQLHGDDEIAQLGETFDAMADSVERNQQLERRLTSDVAHELRTPLMAIQSTVEAMIDGVFEPNEERLDTVNAEVMRLSRMVNAILRLTRLETHSTQLKMQVVDVAGLIDGIIGTHEAFVADSGLELVYRAEHDIYILADPDLITQATANLVSNAVRYTAKGTVTVSVSREGDYAAIAVADTGIGLSEEEARMVFSRFWRADAGRNREQGGLGIGLALVKEIVDQHDGWVRVEGEPGEGSTFTILIPVFSEERQRQLRERARSGKRPIGKQADPT